MPLVVAISAATTTAALGSATGSLSLGHEKRSELIQSILESKPNPGYYAIGSALLPGAGQLALGEWREPALVLGLLFAASTGIYVLCEGHAGIHPAFLGTTAYVFTNGVRIPGSANCGEINDLYNRFLYLAYLVAAGGSAWRTYDLAMQRRLELDRKIESLIP